MSAHQVCLHRPGLPPLQRSFPHSSQGLAGLVAWLSASTAPASPDLISVAIEVPHGPVVVALLSAGFPVFSINPKQLDRFRDRRSPSGAKDDRRDALTLADSLRTDPQAFAQVSIPSDLTLALRAATRRREVLIADSRRFANRLGQLLWTIYPDLLALCPAADEPWLWDLVARLSAPAPRRPTSSTLARLLKAHRKRAVTPAMLSAALAAPPLASGVSLRTTLDDIAVLLPQLTFAHTARSQTERRIGELLRDAGDLATVIDSMPGIDKLLTAVLLSEAPEALVRADLGALRTLAGTAPVTRQSGKSAAVRIRRACNPRLRNALRHWARTAARCSPWARELYSALRARGHHHERALRGLADRLLERLVACLRSNTPYDPALAHRRALTA